MSLTMPQLVMLNEAAEVNRLRGEERYERKKKREEEQEKKNPMVPEFGKRLSELNTNELRIYNAQKMRQIRRP